ncbi:hypothetical protein ACSQUR_003217 [Vibrio alginolyticus]|uniref:hypothetical protein n=1 Tax=Vibrio alginolyticus TaxID=663 RepID=UPI00215CA76B|nr:hypothetical protein [Vibrio alginolyticus]MCR9443114.1 hypothetical protein [Vibrio alginolyticus]MCR9447585.1 hypothetical protein [Vibrio alginolyticus]MCR9458423.1 hypothetical protein [Vibrio alginolyticus]
MGILESEKVFSFINKLPFAGEIFSIANAYAYRGSYKSHSQFAPLELWWRRVFKNIVYVVFFAWFLVAISDKPINEWGWEPSDTILGSFPSILGFGIGIYALMFIMPTDFLLFLKNAKKRGTKNLGPEIVPVDMGYPLMVFIFVIIIAAVNKVFPSNETLKFVSLWALFYGLAMCIELMTFLFVSSRMIQKLRTKSEPKPKKVRYLKRKVKGTKYSG